jgi:hypothetical protein
LWKIGYIWWGIGINLDWELGLEFPGSFVVDLDSGAFLEGSEGIDVGLIFR